MQLKCLLRIFGGESIEGRGTGNPQAVDGSSAVDGKTEFGGGLFRGIGNAGKGGKRDRNGRSGMIRIQ